jgi:putative transcription factor
VNLIGDGLEECELCGRRINEVYTISLENTDLRVCSSCSKGKKVLGVEGQAANAKGRSSTRIVQKKDESETLIENFGEAIRNARERMQLPLKVFAEMINEKEGYLIRIESERALPSDALVKKLENALHMKLTTVKKDDPKIHSQRKGDATLGDFIVR